MQNDPGQEIAPRASTFVADLDAYTPNLMQALPTHVSVDKFKRVLITAVSSNPDLLYANRRTLFTAAVKCASDGLLPDGRDAALVVYNTKIKHRDPNTGLDHERRIDAVQYLPMVAGIRKRMRNTGEVLSAEAHVVYANDKFQYKLGDNGFIDHEPAGLDEEPGPPLGAYAVIKLKSGEVLRDVMRVRDIEVARNQGRAKDGLMWTRFWDEGARKTVLKRCAKAAPQSAELEALLGRDEEPPLLPDFDALPPAVEEPEPQRIEAPAESAPAEEDEMPLYSVIDLDGVEHTFREQANEEAALIRIFEEAAKMGLDRLDGAWDTNKRDGRTVPGRRYRELRAELTKPAAPPVATPQPEPREEVVPDKPQPEHDKSAPPVTPGASDLPTMRIEVPPRRGVPDYRTWYIALFLPKVRQATDSNTLAFLCADNDDNLTAAYERLGKDDAAALRGAIEARYKELD